MNKTIFIGIVIMIFLSTFALAVDISPYFTEPPQFIRDSQTGDLVVRSNGQVYVYTPTANPSIYRVNMNDHLYYVDILSGGYTDQAGNPAVSSAHDPFFGSQESSNFLTQNPAALSGPGTFSSAPAPTAPGPNQAPPAVPTNVRSAAFTDDTHTMIQITDANGRTGQIPAVLVGSVLVNDSRGKIVGVDPNKLGGLLRDFKIAEDGTMTFTIDSAAAKVSELDKGNWVAKQNADGGYEYSRSGGTPWSPLSRTFLVHEAGGSTIIDNPVTRTQRIYDSAGNVAYYCNPVLSFGICKPIDACTTGGTADCYPTGPDANSKPIIITGETGLGGVYGYNSILLQNRCYFNGQTMDYDRGTNSCYGTSKDVNGVATVLIVTADGGKPITATYSSGKITCPEGVDCSKYESEISSQVYQSRLSSGITTGLRQAAAVGNFFNLGKTYGWWKTDASFNIFENLFEQNVLLRQITDPERMICENLNSAYDDLAKDGFLPTLSGQSGADIQASKYFFQEINITTGNASQSYYRYKVTYHVNGQAILKRPNYDINGEAQEKYETSIQVFLDGGNITTRLDICGGDCGDKSSSAGTTSVPLIIRSEKVFAKACIKFYGTDDMDSVVRDYLNSNGDKICNNVQEAYVPARAVTPLGGTTGGPASPNETSSNETGGGNGGGASGPGEIVIP